MDVTRERISSILELREILLSIQTGFSLVNAAVVCTILESISSLETSSVITEPRYLKLVTVSSFCPLTLISVLMPLYQPCDQQESLCQDPAGNRTTRRLDHPKEMQTVVVWSCLPFIRPGKNHHARYSERGKKTRQTEEEVGDNIREWTGLEFAKSQKAVENRGK